MRKSSIFFFLIVGAISFSIGCTSKKVDQENSEISEMAGEGDAAAAEGDEFGSDEMSSDGAKAEGDATAEVTTDAGSDDLDGLEDPGAEPSTDQAATDTTAPAEGASDMATTADPSTDAPSADAPDAPSADGLTADETQGLSEEPVAKAVIPLQKMISAPYKNGKEVINAIYVARTGDTTESVAKKIFGDASKAKALKSINPTLKRRDMKVGDKVYYSSPQRPTDEAAVMTFYEDMGLAPEIYVAQEGDNIRTVAKNLLGDENSWKEVWSTNPDVESKGELVAGTRLRYWSNESSGTVAPPTMAQVDAAPPAQAAPPAPPQMSEAPPPMPDEVQAMAPAGTQAEPPPPPPPPPPAEMAPPPVVADSSAAASPDGGAVTEDPDQMMALGAGAILLLAAVAMFIIIRKKRARRNNAGIDFQTATNTQIE
jgi:hypothetical protein